MPDMQVGISEVYKLLKTLEVHKATGPDGISARWLKETASQFVPAISLLFQASLSQGSVPDEWKRANVAPIFKKGDKQKAENYIPISLIVILCKLQEHIISSQNMQHLDNNNILTDYQHGFRKNRSCESQLILTAHDLAKELDDKGQIDMILLDFSKAFD